MTQFDNTFPHALVLALFQQVSLERLHKAVEGLLMNAYTLTVTSQTEAELRGFVTNGDGKEYGVVLSGGQSFCSCKDAMYRQTPCKHMAVLALYSLRQGAVVKEAQEARPRDLRLTKTRRDWSAPA